ncbi:hypothetical protein B0J17DRAFT_229959 [Rhizoctonia solani]|nr:hypothetical protein B0J17DRAFT_229959 [Rhizoctonia solani]
MLVEEQYFDGVPHGVVPYSSAVLSTCYEPNSPFQLLRKICSEVFPGQIPPALTLARESQALRPRLRPFLSRSTNTSTPALAVSHDRTANMVQPPVRISRPSIVSTSNNGSGVDLVQPSGNNIVSDPQLSGSSFLTTMQLDSIIPPGRNYIHLDEASDALAFIAYATLQANRIACFIRDDLLDRYSQLLPSLTHSHIDRIDTTDQIKRIARTRNNFFAPTSYSIALTPASKFNASAISFKSMSPDCILFWGQPAKARQFVAQILAPLPPSVKTCLMIIGQSQFNGKTYGVEKYPSAVLNAWFQPNSPLQRLRQMSAQLISGGISPAVT